MRSAVGVLHDPNAGTAVNFVRGETTSPLVPVEHVIALGDSWQKGGQQLSSAERIDLANDPLNLIATTQAPNSAKSDSDAASWLPPNFSAPVNLNTMASYPPESLACGKTPDAIPRSSIARPLRSGSGTIVPGAAPVAPLGPPRCEFLCFSCWR
ncbi:HNH endonuclease family protein [Rhodococcus qingshengii]|uniref:HNH endonuclease family protein n=1 Tax=Rhodococcus qingshengii TaxID=334542 RepID=UPI003514D75E